MHCRKSDDIAQPNNDENHSRQASKSTNWCKIQVIEGVRCLKCGATWSDVYALVGIVPIGVPEKPVDQPDDLDAIPAEFTESAEGYGARDTRARGYDDLSGAPENDGDC